MTVKHTTWHTHLIKDPKPGEPITALVEGFSCKDCGAGIKVTSNAPTNVAVITIEQKKFSTKEQAEMALKLLRKEGLVTTAQLSAINQKYPSDPIYHARKLIGYDKILTIKAEKGKTLYKLIL